MYENIKITKEEMLLRGFFNDFLGGLDKLDDAQVAYAIRHMTKHTDQDKKYVWIMSESVETRLLNAIHFPEMLIVDDKISYLLGYPVKYGEDITYPYIWLGECEIMTSATDISKNEKEFLNQSYAQIDECLEIMWRHMEKTLDTYVKMFNPSKKGVVNFVKKINAHVNQTL